MAAKIVLAAMVLVLWVLAVFSLPNNDAPAPLLPCAVAPQQPCYQPGL